MGAIGREHVDAARSRREEIALGVDLHAVGLAFFVRVQGVASKKTRPPPRAPSGARS